MKICFISDVIYPYVKGGAERRIWEISKRLAKRGHEIHIYGMRWWKKQDIIRREGVYLHGVCKPYELYASDGKRAIKPPIIFASKVLYPILKEEFDLIDCSEFPYFPCFSAKLASIKNKIPFIITWHELWGNYWYEYLGWKGIFGKIIEKMTVKLPDKIFAVSNQTKEDLIKFGVDSSKIDVIYNGIDFSFIQSISKEKEHYYDIIFVGRLIKERNIDILLQSVKLLKKKIKNIKVAIIGDGPEKKHLIQLSIKLNLDKNVVFFGFINDFSEVVSIMKSSKIFVHPSTREGGGSIVSIEANACGLPVIAIDHELGIDKTLIKEGYNGFFVKLDPMSLAKKIEFALKDENLLEEMRKNSISFSQQFDWEYITDQYLKQCRRLVE